MAVGETSPGSERIKNFCGSGEVVGKRFMFIFEGDVFLVNFPDGDVVLDVSRVGVVIEH